MLLEKIEYHSSVDQSEWDRLALSLGGSFFHCYAYATLETSREGVKPIFVKAFAPNGECVGIAVCIVSSPRLWPFSRFCKTAVVGALPATKEGYSELEPAIMNFLERDLKAQGVFQIEICSYESPNSLKVLSAFSGKLSDRVEFYLDLSRPTDDIWKTLKSTRRNDIRKAEKLGVESRSENTMKGVQQLYGFQTESLQRRGIQFDPFYIQAERLQTSVLDTQRARLLVSYRDGVPVNAGLFGLFGGRAYYLASGSSRDGYKCCGPAHLLWTAIQMLKSEGATTLNLGGVDGPIDHERGMKDGLYNFKNDFGGVVIPQPRGLKTISWIGAKLQSGLMLSKQIAGAKKTFLRLSSLWSKVHTLASSFYQVPWCVPPWGWTEFRTCLHAILKGRLVQGPDCRRFTDQVRSHLRVSYVLPVNRGGTGLELALRALDIGPGVDVVLPSYVCRAVLDAVNRIEAHPVFADVGPDLNVTVETIRAALTPQTKCVIVPHLFGRAAAIHEIETLLSGTGIAIIDDAAQSYGARCAGRLVGTFGVWGVVSCGPGKSLAGPAGGVVLTNDRRLYERAAAIPLAHEDGRRVLGRLLSFWLWRRFRWWTLPIKLLLTRIVQTEKHPFLSAYTLSNVDAAIAVRQLDTLEQNSIQRRKNAENLLSALGPLKQYNVTDLSKDGMALKLVLVLPLSGPTVEEVVELLAKVGIECQPGYTPLHLTEPVAGPILPVTEALWKRVVCIPVDIEFKNMASLLRLSQLWLESATSKTSNLAPTV
jgi:dTDP-4-amino-4,6-dideoxygalactose transaminase